MLFKSSTIAAFLATVSLAVSSPTEAKRAVGTIIFSNGTPREINYALVGPNGVVRSGTVESGFNAPASSTKGTQSLPLPPAGQGYSLKLSQGNPQSATGILQFQYTRNSDNNIVYNWSALNGDSEADSKFEDPFFTYTRVITPLHPAGQCKVIECQLWTGDTSCEATTAGQGPVGVCPATNDAVLTVAVAGP